MKISAEDCKNCRLTESRHVKCRWLDEYFNLFVWITPFLLSSCFPHDDPDRLFQRIVISQGEYRSGPALSETELFNLVISSFSLKVGCLSRAVGGSSPDLCLHVQMPDVYSYV